MKKNIFTIIIMALAVVNVVLTAVIVFTVVPSMNRTNNLIKQITQVIDLELEASEMDDNSVVSIKDRENHEFTNTAGTVTINLKKGADNKDHWAQLDAVIVTVNKSGEDYGDLVANLTEKKSDVINVVSDVIGGLDYETISSSRDDMKEEIIKRLQEHFESETIIDVSFDNLRFQ